MARITIEDCLKAGYNKFALVHLAAKRVIQFRRGKEPLVSTSNKEVVTALREIAAGKVWMKQGNVLSGEELTGEDRTGDGLEKGPEASDNGENLDVSQSEDLSDET
jgi:DNA-directed RNA polymerase subunit omega